MKRFISLGLMGVMLCSSVFAAEFYTVEPVSAGIFGTPTSVTTVVVGDNVNVASIDKSKNSALIPPTFGSNTSNLRYTGEPLTPNLASPYADMVTGNLTLGTIAGITNQPTVTVTTNTNPYIQSNGTTSSFDDYFEEEAFTKVTSSMYYSGGHIGTLKIPELDLSVKIYEGTTESVLKKGIGHFKDSSIWNGNVCLAAHNRGTNDYFGEIHELDYGDTIKLTTKKGTRTYRVFSVEKISVNDTSDLQGTSDNIITLITCVKNQSDRYRWCVQARQID